jgi:DNA protecting protein DprA
MTLFGLDEATVLTGALSVRADDAGDDTQNGIDQVTETFARAAWTGIAEPGDSMAGTLVEGLGAIIALDAILDSWSPTRLADALRAVGADDPLLTTDISRGLDRWRPRLKSADVLHNLAQASRVGARLIVPSDPLWPAAVSDLGPHAPLALWWRGVPEALLALGRSISLVGARAATGYGKHVALEASAGLVDRGFAIVSGAAYGIDGTAHSGALSNSGMTVAILAGGVDRFYPSGHDAMLARIVRVGAVLSELPCGSTPTKWRFLQRNRLIAAASNATVVIEAGWRSGSLNTAAHAASLGRPLGAVPGPVTSPASTGCHRLIREFDAVCVTDADEMAELAAARFPSGNLESIRQSPDEPRSEGRSSDQVRAIDALSRRSPRSVQDIAARAGLSTSAVIAALGALGLEGVVRERDDGWVLTSSRMTA